MGRAHVVFGNMMVTGDGVWVDSVEWSGAEVWLNLMKGKMQMIKWI